MKLFKGSLCFLFVFIPAVVFAWGGSLTSPEIGPGPGATDAGIYKTLDVLNKKADFLRGSFVNWCTTMEFGGSTEIASEVIETLVEEACLDVTVQFARLKDPTVSFMIYQDTMKSITTVTFNLNYLDINLTKLKVSASSKNKSDEKEDKKTPSPESDQG